MTSCESTLLVVLVKLSLRDEAVELTSESSADLPSLLGSSEGLLGWQVLLKGGWTWGERRRNLDMAVGCGSSGV